MAEPRDEVLAAWQAAGTEELMLPTGTEIRMLLPGPGALARLGLSPTTLLTIAAHRTGEIEHGGMSDEDWARWEAKIAVLICDSVLAIKPPGFDDFAEWTFSPDDLKQHRVPPVDHDALVSLVTTFETPAQVDARSRVVHRGMSVSHAARIFAREEARTIPGWGEFIESEQGLMVALTARTFGQLPSTMLRIDNPTTALAVDVGAMGRIAFLRPAKKQPLDPDYYERPDAEPYDPAVAAEVQNAHLERLRAEGRLKAEPTH